MTEKGRYFLTVRKETAMRVREFARNRDLTVDKFLNEFIRPSLKGGG